MKKQNFLIGNCLRILTMALCAVSVISCTNKQGGQMGAPEYAVITLEPTAVDLSSSYPATIRGCQDIEIRPNVSGFITKLCVDEGSVVQKGQTLFLIDPVQYEEAVNVARAAVEVGKASVSTAELTAHNKRQLAAQNIISEYELQMAENTLASQKAALAQAQAQLINAEKNLSYTRVSSPSNGVVGTIPFRVGSLVSPSSATPLTTVSDITEMYVYFSMNEKQLLDLTRKGSTDGVISRMPEVSLRLADGTIYPERGRIETISGVIDRTTGAANVRATFPNSARLLRSGASGIVMMPEKDDAALLVPQKATYEIQDKKFVYMLGDSMIVKSVEITIMPVDDGQQYIVTSGLKAGDRVVVEGVGTSIREGMTIKPITPEESTAKLEGAIKQNAAGK